MLRQYLFLFLGVVGCSESVSQPQEVVIQIGHANELDHCVTSEDGQYLLTTASRYRQEANMTVILWDTSTGERLRSYVVPSTYRAPEFAMAGQIVICNDRVFDRDSGRLLMKLVAPDRKLTVCHVGDDHSKVIIADDHGHAAAINLQTREAEISWDYSDWFASGTATATDKISGRPGNQNVVLDTRISSDESLMGLIMESGDKSAHRSLIGVWNFSEKSKVCDIPVDIIDAAYFSPGGHYVVTRHWDDTGAPDEQVKIFDARNGHLVLERRELSDSAYRLPFITNDHTCLLGTKTQTAMLLDLRSKEVIRKFESPDKIQQFRMRQNGEVIDAHTETGVIRWSISTGNRLPDYAAPDSVAPAPREVYKSFRGELPVKPTLYLPEANSFVGKAGPEKWLCNLTTGEQLALLSTVRDDRYQLQFNNDGRRALTLTSNVWRLWDMEHGHLLQTFGYKSNPNVMHSPPLVSFSENGEFVCTHERCGSVWRALDGAPVPDNPVSLNLQPGKRPMNWSDNQFGYRPRGRGDGAYHGHSLLSRDHRLMASWNNRRQPDQQVVEIWDLNAGKIIHRLQCPDATLTFRGSFSPDGKYFSISDLTAKQIIVWNLEDGRILTKLEIGGGSINSRYRNNPTTFLPDGTHVLFSSDHRTLTMADARSGQIIHSMEDKTPMPRGVKPPVIRADLLLSPDNRYVVADYGTSYSLVWNLQTGNTALRINHDTGNVSVHDRLQFNEDSTQILDPQNDGVHVWDLASKEEHVVQHSKWLRGGIDGFRKWQSPRFDNLDEYPEALLRQWSDVLPDFYLSARVTKDGKRLIVHENRLTYSFWNTSDKSLIARSYQYQFGAEWLTVNANNEWFGSAERIRHRIPGTINVQRVPTDLANYRDGQRR